MVRKECYQVCPRPPSPDSISGNLQIGAEGKISFSAYIISYPYISFSMYKFLFYCTYLHSSAPALSCSWLPPPSASAIRVVCQVALLIVAVELKSTLPLPPSTPSRCSHCHRWPPALCSISRLGPVLGRHTVSIRHRHGLRHPTLLRHGHLLLDLRCHLLHHPLPTHELCVTCSKCCRRLHTSHGLLLPFRIQLPCSFNSLFFV